MPTGSPCCGPQRGPSPTSVSSRPKRKRQTNRRALKNMVPLSGGRFRMGTDDVSGFPEDGEGPIRDVEIWPFRMGRYAVTNAEFSRFTKATGYKTEAELFGWTFVFHRFVPSEAARRVDRVPQDTPWWWPVEGAFWAKPEGPSSDLKGRGSHPAVHISWNDAVAYCDWAGARLPTEAEWEFAARGGLSKKTYPWGDNLTPHGSHRCNIWQGSFPDRNTEEDGFTGTAPVDAFEPNGYGLHNLAGNVWEWCSDWFSPDYHTASESVNPTGPDSGGAKSMRGGSYLCHDSYCNRYRVAARSANTPDSSTGNLGFRCAADIDQGE